MKPVILVILDGWGHNDSHTDNAIQAANTPNWDEALQHFPHGLINASERHVGLPKGQMGNSEVGHMNIGSGRVCLQDLPRIDKAVESGELAQKLEAAMPEDHKPVHLMGLLSDGGVHSHESHIIALAQALSQQGRPVYIHAFLDGRDTPPQSALSYVATLEAAIDKLPNVCIATICGRYYAMDRDKRWDRVSKAYHMLLSAEGSVFKTAQAAIEASYTAKVNDEFLLPCIIGDYKGIQQGDALVMANFRADRVRQLLDALLEPEFKGFARTKTTSFSVAVAMSEYSKSLAERMKILFAPETLTDILGEVVSRAGFKQLRIAETEKYAHVTFFFNGGRELEFDGEERILVPSPNVATYDLKPEMSAYEVTDKLVAAIASGGFDLIVVNYANTDMVGHTGNMEAAIKAVEVVDRCLGRVITAARAQGGAVVITADHGNAETMFDHATVQAHTAHTLNLVPLVVVADIFKDRPIHIPEGCLGDVAPTVLQLLQLPQPSAMTGHSLLPAHAT